MRMLKRIMTEKSRFDWGKPGLKGYTVKDLLIQNKHGKLIEIYYGLDKVGFCDEVLDKIGITTENRIEKPGKIQDTKKRWMLIRMATANCYTKEQISNYNLKRWNANRMQESRFVNLMNNSTKGFLRKKTQQG